MSEETKKLLEAFAKKAQWKTSMWASGLELFFDFVIVAHRKGEEISQDDFLAVVDAGGKDGVGEARRGTSAGLQRELASKIFMYHKYEEGRLLLKKFEKK